MVGQGVLRECLIDPGVETVLSLGRSPLRVQHAKLRDIVHKDFIDYSAIESRLTGYDACFFCLGVAGPLLAWMVHATPNQMTTSERLGRAMINVVRNGYPRPILESADINTF